MEPTKATSRWSWEPPRRIGREQVVRRRKIGSLVLAFGFRSLHSLLRWRREVVRAGFLTTGDFRNLLVYKKLCVFIWRMAGGLVARRSGGWNVVERWRLRGACHGRRTAVVDWPQTDRYSTGPIVGYAVVAPAIEPGAFLGRVAAGQWYRGGGRWAVHFAAECSSLGSGLWPRPPHSADTVPQQGFSDFRRRAPAIALEHPWLIAGPGRIGLWTGAGRQVRMGRGPACGYGYPVV